MPKIRPDFIVIGSGTSGSLLTSLLSKHFSTTLLEAGPSNHVLKSTPWLRIPLGYLYTMTMKSTSWEGFTTPVGKTKTIHYPRGRILGGCSSINGMIYQEGQTADYDNWKIPGWSGNDMRVKFDKILSLGHRKDKQRLTWKVLDDVAQGFKEITPAISDDPSTNTREFTNSNVESVGYFLANQINGIRLSAYDAFIGGALGGVPNERRCESESDYGSDGSLNVVTGAFVKRLIFEGEDDNGNLPETTKAPKVIGVEYYTESSPGVTCPNTPPIKIYCNKEVLISAGSIGSPHLLQVSGIGPRALLESLDIQCKVDLEGVGGNLQDHLQLRSVYKLNETDRNGDDVVTLNALASTYLGQLKMGIQYILTRTGPLSMAPSQLGAFLKSDPSLSTPDLQWHCQPLSLPKFGDPLHSFPGITLAVCNLRPSSRGSIKLVSKDIRVPPAIDCNYLSTDHDRDVAVRGMRLTRAIAKSKVMSKYNPIEMIPGNEYESDDDLKIAAEMVGTSIFHPVGTCKLGHISSDLSWVVDPDMKVRGVDCLRVIDASVMPYITSGNTNTPTLGIGFKGGEVILREYLMEKVGEEEEEVEVLV